MWWLAQTITIDTDNAAFDPDPNPEVARILREVIKDLASEAINFSKRNGRIGHMILGMAYMDGNGNTVGRAWKS